MLDLAIVGFGAIGQELARVLNGAPGIELAQIVVTPRSIERVRSLAAQSAPQARVLTELDLTADRRPDMLAECAGHAAILSHVVPALCAGQVEMSHYQGHRKCRIAV